MTVFFFLWNILLLSGCSFSRFGRADVTFFKIEAPAGLVGLTKSQIIEKIGPPEGAIADEKGAEYWEYNNPNNYYIVLFGRGGHKNLLLKIENNVVVSSYLIEKGASFNILSGGM
jgi:hypothetical protein